MGRKLANLWPCRRAKSLCGTAEIARARFFSTLNGPRTTIGCYDELFGRAHDRHEFSRFLSFGFPIFLRFSLSAYVSLSHASKSTAQSRMRMANRLPLFGNVTGYLAISCRSAVKRVFPSNSDQNCPKVHRSTVARILNYSPRAREIVAEINLWNLRDRAKTAAKTFGIFFYRQKKM